MSFLIDRELIPELDSEYCFVAKHDLAVAAYSLNHQCIEERDLLLRWASIYNKNEPHPLSWPAERKNKYVVVQLTGDEKRMLGHKWPFVILADLKLMASPPVPLTKIETFRQAWVNLVHPDRKDVACSLLRDEQRHMMDRWDNVVKAYDRSVAAKKQLNIMQYEDTALVSDLTAVNMFLRTLKNGPDRYLLPTALVQRADVMFEERLTGTKKVDLPQLFEEMTKEISSENQTRLRQMLDEPLRMLRDTLAAGHSTRQPKP